MALVIDGANNTISASPAANVVFQSNVVFSNTTVFTANATFTTPATFSANVTFSGTVAGISATGRIIRAPNTFLTNGSFTTSSSTNFILLEMIGGGGGGGGALGLPGPSSGGGGGGSVYANKFVAVTPSTTYSFTIGNGGTIPGTGSTGGTGGNTSISIGGITYLVSGGGGGISGPGSGSGAVGYTGTANNMDTVITPLYPASGRSGGGVSTPYGESIGGSAQGYSIGNPSDGLRGIGYGAGGGGAFNGGSYGFNFSGGVGTQGMLRITEFS